MIIREIRIVKIIISLLTTKQVSSDSGALELHKVFELIAEGESLPVHFDKELKVTSKYNDLDCSRNTFIDFLFSYSYRYMFLVTAVITRT